MTIAPYPPTPLIIGSTTPSAAETATAASKAFPPASRTSSPARVASGWAVLTIPLVPTAGRFAVFLLAGSSTGPSSCSAAGSGVVPVVFSPVEVASSAAPLPREASLDWAPQEQRRTTSSARRRTETLLGSTPDILEHFSGGARP